MSMGALTMMSGCKNFIFPYISASKRVEGSLCANQHSMENNRIHAVVEIAQILS